MSDREEATKKKLRKTVVGPLDRPKAARDTGHSGTPPARTRAIPAPRRATGSASVDLGPLNVFEQAGLPKPQDRVVKATLVTRLRAALADRDLTQAEAGAIMGLARAEVSELVSGGASGFSPERLLTLLNKLGVLVAIAFHREADFAPGETSFLWDRDRDGEVEDAAGFRGKFGGGQSRPPDAVPHVGEGRD